MPTTQHARQKITPMLWFDNREEEAANFYVSIFRNAKIGAMARYGAAGPGPAGTVMTVAFSLDGPIFKFNEAISLVVNCESQAEIDRLWSALTAGGAEGQCGWLKDKFGLSWQIVPTVLIDALTGPDAQSAQRVTQAMMKIRKLDIEALLGARDHACQGRRLSRSRP